MLTDVRALRVNRGDRVIEVKITVIKAKKFRNLEDRPLNTGSTVIMVNEKKGEGGGGSRESLCNITYIPRDSSVCGLHSKLHVGKDNSGNFHQPTHSRSRNPNRNIHQGI